MTATELNTLSGKILDFLKTEVEPTPENLRNVVHALDALRVSLVSFLSDMDEADLIRASSRLTEDTTDGR